MLRAAAAVLGLAIGLGLGQAVAACPAFHNKDKHLHLTARQLATPRIAEVRAGGSVLLGQCPDLPGTGNIPFDPSVSILYVADRKRMDLEFRTEGSCDTVLLLRSPSGRWHFDDDNGQGHNARIRVAAPPEGRWEIWVGSQAGMACTTRLAIQTFRAVTRLASAGPQRI
jgi:hypothetical protein